ncbi:hypothetical protein EHS25_004413 [Saitozyma podzolica]|uniref:Template-activating factor I n=1 Tax=Saitozyma podzolica TaxID=1890683 RepID=A0A427YU77_9TREE|nr:hypothetical protein EHS25_004413 [Saitozyma podzolica]
MSTEEFELDAPDLSPKLLEELEAESGKRKWNNLKFGTEETLAHLAFIKKKTEEEPETFKNFWPLALLQNIIVHRAASSSSDKEALTYLSEIELKQDVKDPRPYELVFHFRENPFFSNKTLSKKYTLPEGVASAPTDGSVTQEMRDFDPEDDLIPSTISIEWKSDAVNLTKKFPRGVATASSEEGDDEGFDGDAGSFFHFFTEQFDPHSLRAILHDDILPDAVEYFLGRGDNSPFDEDEDDDELDEEDEGDDDEEIDLEEEERSSKRRKT